MPRVRRFSPGLAAEAVAAIAEEVAAGVAPGGGEPAPA